MEDQNPSQEGQEGQQEQNVQGDPLAPDVLAAPPVNLSDSELDALAAATLQPEPEPSHSEPGFPFPMKTTARDERSRLARSRRTRNLLIVTIVVLILAAVALAWFGYHTLFKQSVQEQPVLKQSTDLVPSGTDNAKVETKPVYKTASIPGMRPLFGLTIDEASAKLGSQWVLDKNEDAKDSNNPNVKKLATLRYLPQLESGGAPSADASISLSSDTPPVANLYLSTDSQGHVIAILYSADMDLLGYPKSGFASLLADDKLVLNALESAGIGPKDFQYAAPDMRAATSYDYPDSADRKVSKQTTLFSGRTANDGLPGAWVVTVTYQFVPATSTPNDAAGAARTIYISLA
ncbi:MAG: hypothetical protein FWF71_07100 [Actinomycetia bacterium]|nr:hypothetical protein [Actinomycetes bacterium]